jgi:hypothetical protein
LCRIPPYMISGGPHWTVRCDCNCKFSGYEYLKSYHIIAVPVGHASHAIFVEVGCSPAAHRLHVPLEPAVPVGHASHTIFVEVGFSPANLLTSISIIISPECRLCCGDALPMQEQAKYFYASLLQQ